MTQRPFGSEPTTPGPFDEPGAGNPDVAGYSAGATTPDPGYSTGTGYTTTDYTTTDTDLGTSSGSDSKVDTAKGEAKNVADTAKGEAKQVADTALSSGKDVAETAKQEARNVVGEARQQAASLFDTVRTEVTEQGRTQQGRIAEAVHSLSKELGSMASSTEESGPLTDLAQQASRKGGEIAHWLQEREPADVLEAVRSYGRRRPVTFLALCALAGVVAGRLTRSAVATRTELDNKDTGSDRRELGTGYTSTNVGYADPGRSASYATTPANEPALESSDAMSTGVYGGTVESTEPATAPYGDTTISNSGYVGTTRPLDDPNGDPLR